MNGGFSPAAFGAVNGQMARRSVNLDAGGNRSEILDSAATLRSKRLGRLAPRHEARVHARASTACLDGLPAGGRHLCWGWMQNQLLHTPVRALGHVDFVL